MSAFVKGYADTRPLFHTCNKCGAIISMDKVELHTRWHEKLRRAVDEAEILD